MDLVVYLKLHPSRCTSERGLATLLDRTREGSFEEGTAWWTVEAIVTSRYRLKPSRSPGTAQVLRYIVMMACGPVMKPRSGQVGSAQVRPAQAQSKPWQHFDWGPMRRPA